MKITPGIQSGTQTRLSVVILLATIAAAGASMVSASGGIARQPSSGIDVRALFLKEAAAQGVRVRRSLPDGRIVVAVHGEELIVSLANLARNVERDRDPAAVRRFVSTIRSTQVSLPRWTESKRRIRYALEPADQQFGDSIRQRITGGIVRVLTYVDPSEKDIRWLTPHDIHRWGVSPDQASRAALTNMAELLSQTPLHVEPIQRHRLAMLQTRSVFKAALILSPNLKQKVQSTLGWPVRVVVPCRDFAYLFSTSDSELTTRIGEVVLKEYRNSGYPISPELLEVSDRGIRAIGTFAARRSGQVGHF
jgi:hypothetical protein